MEKFQVENLKKRSKKIFLLSSVIKQQFDIPRTSTNELAAEAKQT